jgi:hypothetical protein
VAAAGSSGGGHAVLHDFCMAIPYGTLALVGGLVALVSGGGLLAGGVAAGGALVCAMAALSLKAWKARTACTPYTLVSAGTHNNQICTNSENIRKCHNLSCTEMVKRV